jgi:N-acyl-D-amino-acid deacylase
MDFDLVIANGTVIDGTGGPRFRAELGIRRGRIAALSRAAPLAGRETLDADGLAVAPGFIDIHSHSDWVLPLPDHQRILAPLVLQGITTMVVGNCGFSPAPVTDRSIPLVNADAGTLRDGDFPYRWRSVAEFLDVIERSGVFLNTALLAGHGTIRRAVLGERPEAPDREETAALRALARQALREGAFGLSAGLAYSPGAFAGGDELLALLRVVAEENGLYAVDDRCYRCASSASAAPAGAIPANVAAVREQLDLARQAGAKLQISHLIFVGRSTWPTHRQVLEDIEGAAAGGLDVAFDAYPYTFGNTTININFPKWFLADLAANLDDRDALGRLEQALEAHFRAIGRGYRDMTLLWGGAPEFAALEGLDFTAIARRLGLSEFEAYMHIARRTGGTARIMQDTFSGDAQSEEPLRKVLAHPLCAFMLDVILTRRGAAHPAAYGGFPRILGRYCRDLRLFSLEEAVRRMTSFPAGRLGLRDTGRVAEDCWADLVVFNPETIADGATAQRPDAPPTGVEAVLISGQLVAMRGRLVSQARRGRLLRPR